MVRVIVASILYVSIMALYLSQGGAPVRVHVATAGALAVGFLLPAFAIGSLGEFARRWKFVIAVVLIGSVVFDFLTSLVVAKAEFLGGWYLKYPILFVGFSALLFMHAAVCGVVSRRAAAA
jgi:hypothetical protein